MNIYGAKFINNTGINGGGAFISRYSNVTINSGEFIGNTSGGAITIASASLEINNVEISNNEAKTYNGGGINIYALLSNPDNGYSNFTMNNGTIANNKAAKNGGGIYVTAGHTYNYVGGTITNNTPDNVYQN